MKSTPAREPPVLVLARHEAGASARLQHLLLGRDRVHALPALRHLQLEHPETGENLAILSGVDVVILKYIFVQKIGDFDTKFGYFMPTNLS
jgi:hypothetical protein